MGGRRGMAVACLVGAVLLAGCTAVPGPDGSPSATATTSASRGSTAAAASPTASMPPVEVLRVAADPAVDLRCRPLSIAEWDLAPHLSLPEERQHPVVVDLDDRWAVVAFWIGSSGAETLDAVVLADRRFSTSLPTAWDGSLPDFGVVLEDGPKAKEAAQNCLARVVDPLDQPRPDFTCQKPTRAELLRVQKAVWGGTDGNPTGGGAYVEGGETPEGKPWQIHAVNTDSDAGVATVLVTRPSAAFKSGQNARDEFSPISDGWDGQLAEFRGVVQWGQEGQTAARDCLTRR